MEHPSGKELPQQELDGQEKGKAQGAPPGLPEGGFPVLLVVQGGVGLEGKRVGPRLGGEDAEGGGLVRQRPPGVLAQVQVVLVVLPQLVGVLFRGAQLHAVAEVGPLRPPEEGQPAEEPLEGPARRRPAVEGGFQGLGVWD